jgi:hypothetical protein
MRLLQAELLKLRRPLLLWVVVAMVGFMALTAWGQVHDAAIQYQFSQQQPDQGVMIGQPSCTDLGLPEGQQCEAAKQQQLAEMRQSMQASLAQAALQRRRMQHPLAIGALAAGMLASVPGALSWLSCWRRLQVRWDRDAGRWFAFVLVTCAVVCFNRL